MRALTQHTLTPKPKAKHRTLRPARLGHTVRLILYTAQKLYCNTQAISHLGQRELNYCVGAVVCSFVAQVIAPP